MTQDRVARIIVALVWMAAIVGLVALGTWQVHRLAWKRALIAQVEARLKARPAAAPPTAGPGDAYRRIVVSGTFLPVHDSFVQASTIRGPGWWVMTPLLLTDGRTILVNRGYVAKRRSARPPCSRGARCPSTISGLLRLTEPGGGFLRSNDPSADRWYSRDVMAIAAKRGIGRVVPYFIDLEAPLPTRSFRVKSSNAVLPGEAGASTTLDTNGSTDTQPIPGLTVVSFPNNHLAYAITWYILAAMTAASFLYWLRPGIRR